NTTWDKTEAFFGQPWIWNVICNEDQKVNMSGDLKQMQINFDKAFRNEINNNLVGVGTIPEGLGYNPIVQEFIYEKAWNQSTVDINSWIRNYAKRRYGTDNPSALEAWEELYASVYSRTRTLWNPLITTPRLQIFKGPAEDIRHVRKDIVITGDNPLGMDFNVSSLYKAAEKLIACEEELNESESYRFDLVNIHRELLSSLSHLFIHNLSESYKKRDIEEFDLAAENILGLIDDLERVTATHEMFSLPAWIEDARSWGLTPQEADYYETNARTIITIWQPWKEGSLRDYAGKQWSGLFKTYYYPRWELFISHLEKSLKEKSTFEYRDYDKAIRDIDYAWINSKETIKTETDQDLFSTVKEINNKYKKYFTQ
ncbi:MAG: alpha-N-acetylglucosaminidase C-terminal domain-containing protein, partial [Bacteroidales bacterium]|nr:alpha-N-acetylglucosaminidase C-terminal domain-containing protein [Bacteroidales bacterium]